MARRPKRIKVELLNDLSKEGYLPVVDQIVDDLLRKFPRGPDCALLRSDYRESYHSGPVLGEEQHGHTVQGCGYADLTLYRMCQALNIDGSEWDWKHYVRRRFPHLRQTGITRRSRRLGNRVETACRNIRRLGLPGIYEVSFGWQNNVQVYAENSAMAEAAATTSLGWAYAGEGSASASFKREGNPSEVLGLNDKAITKEAKQADQCREQIAKLQKQIETHEARSMAITTYSVACVTE